MKNSLIGLFVISMAFFVSAISSVDASFGISPAEYENTRLKPGMHVEESVFLTQANPDVDLEVSWKRELSEIDSWIRIEPSDQFIIPAGTQSYESKIIIDIPQDAALRDYTGILRAQISSVAEGGDANVSIVKGARFDINLTLTDQDYVDLLIRNVGIEDVPAGKSIVLKALVENRGNVATSPTHAVIDLINLKGEKISKTESIGDIDLVEPGEIQEVEIVFPVTNASEGEYFADVYVYYNLELLRQEKLVFRILAGSADTQVSNVISDNLGIDIETKQIYIVATSLLLLIFALGIFLLLNKKNKVNKSSTLP